METSTAGLEVFIRNADLNRLFDWVKKHSDGFDEPIIEENLSIFKSNQGSIVIGPTEDPNFTSLWWNAPHPLWKTHFELAKAISADLNCGVRCDPAGSPYSASVHSPVFLEIFKGQVDFIAWE